MKNIPLKSRLFFMLLFSPSLMLSQAPVHPAQGTNDYTGPVGCSPPSTPEKFSEIKQKIGAAGISAATKASIYLHNNCFTTDQVGAMMNLISMSLKREQFAEKAFHSTYDQANFDKLIDLLSLESHKEKLRKYLAKQREFSSTSLKSEPQSNNAKPASIGNTVQNINPDGSLFQSDHKVKALSAAGITYNEHKMDVYDDRGEYIGTSTAVQGNVDLNQLGNTVKSVTGVFKKNDSKQGPANEKVDTNSETPNAITPETPPPPITITDPIINLEEPGLAYVSVINGLKVYALNTPKNTYEVLYTVKAPNFNPGFQKKFNAMGSPVTNNLNNMTKMAVNKSKKVGKIDAIVTNDCNTATVIRFNDPQHTNIGKVQTTEGLDIYLQSTPIKKYEEQFEVQVKGVALTRIDAQKMISKLVTKVKEEAQKKNILINGIISLDGKTAKGITYSE